MAVGFIILALISFLSALGVIVAKSPVHSALALIANIITLAVFYLVLNAEFLAAAQVIVYAGAIMVLFLFVVTLLTAGKEEGEAPEQLGGQQAAAGILGVIIGILLAGIAVRYAGQGHVSLRIPQGFGSLETMGRVLWGPGFDYLAILALMLLTAALGVMVLNRPGPEPRGSKGGDGA